MAHLYERVLSIITKPPDERKISEIHKILPWFRKKSELFKDLKPEIVIDIIKNCEFTSCHKDQVVIRQGDKGECFYIILTGTVVIYINTNLTEEEYESVKQKQLEEEAAIEATGEKVRSLDRSKYGNYLGKIDAGKSFGELALIRADSVRNASIITDEPTDLLMVNRDLYNRSLHAYQAQEFDKRKRFVDEFPLFHNWQPKYKKMMAMSLVKQNLKFEDLVVKQAVPVDGLHFILSGQVKIVVDPSQHATQYPTLFPTGDIADLEKEKARERLRREMNLERQRATDKKMTFQKRKTPQPEGRKGAQRHIELCLMGAVDIIGDLEMVLNLPTYAQSVICTQEAEIYALDQRNYDRLIEKRNPQAIEMMKNIVHTKLSLHFSRLSEARLPLFRYFLYTLDEKEKNARDRESHHVSDKTSDTGWKVDNLKKGPLVNLFGPGSVFYMIRMREKEKKKKSMRPQQFGGMRFGVTSQSFHFGAKPLPDVGKGNTQNAADVSRGLNLDNWLITTPKIVDQSKSTSVRQIPSPPKIIYEGPGKEPEDNLKDTTIFSQDISKGRDSTETNSSPIHADYDEFDSADEWTVGDMALSQLEDRIQAWHSSFEDHDSRAAKRAVKLHRYQVEEEKKPKPGNKVYIRSRDRSRSVAFYSYGNEDEMTEADSRNKSYSVVSRTPLSSARMYDLVSNHPSEVEHSSELTRKSRQSSKRKMSQSVKSSTFKFRADKQKAKKQYTVEEYQALKEELRRRQKAYKSFLPQRTSYTVF